MSVTLIRPTDYTLSNPDTLTKYKTAATIAEKVLKEVSGVYFRGILLHFTPWLSHCKTWADDTRMDQGGRQHRRTL